MSDDKKNKENMDEVYSLEDILSEYKGSAFMNNESRLSKDELEKEADEIIREVADMDKPHAGEHDEAENLDNIIEDNTKKNAPEEKAESAAEIDEASNGMPPVPQEAPKQTKNDVNVQPKAEAPEVSQKKTAVEKPEAEKKHRRGEVVRKKKTGKIEATAKQSIEKGIERGIHEMQGMLNWDNEAPEKQSGNFSYHELSEDEQMFFGVGKYSRKRSEKEENADIEEVSETVTKEMKRRERVEAHRRQRAKKEDGDTEAPVIERKELSAANAIKVYASSIGSIRLRMIPVGIICIIISYLTCSLDLGWPLPEFLHPVFINTLVIMIGLLIAIMCALDVFAAGVINAMRGKFSAETLVVASCLFSVLDSILRISISSMDFGTPYCALAAVSILGAMWGTMKGKRAFYLTFKLVSQTNVPTVVSSEWEKVDEGAVMTKNLGTAKGFINKTTELNLEQSAYNIAAPLLIIASVALSAVSAYLNGNMQSFVHCLSGISAISAPFTMLLIFNKPFLAAAQHLLDHGAAIAGWSGACDMKRAVGMVVKDLDLFPENTMSLNGVKVLSKISVERIVSYTGSLIIASGAGTSRIFAELMREYASSLYRVDEFSCYESGGIGAEINGCHVLVGSAAFMNLMGIHMPPNLDIKNAVYSAINSELAGVFIINYMPADTVQTALVSMIQDRITPIFAIRDFNITPALIRNKFKISLDEGEFTTFAARYELSQKSDSNMEPGSAIMSREGINHFVETISSGRRMVTITRRSLFISLLSTILGIILMFLILSTGAFTAVSAAHTLTYTVMWAIASLLASNF